jgi:hypothetical protein
VVAQAEASSPIRSKVERVGMRLTLAQAQGEDRSDVIFPVGQRVAYEAPTRRDG